jgi:hypothetical protein
MSDKCTPHPQKPSYESVYNHGFVFGRSEDLQREISKPLGTDDGESVEMLHAVHCGAALAGLATKLADMAGEENAYFALQQAANAVAVHCFKKRNAD